MSYQSYISQALKNIYNKRQNQGYPQQQNQGYGGYSGLTQMRETETGVFGGGQPMKPIPSWGEAPQMQPASQTSSISEALGNMFQDMPTSWDWEGGEAAPFAIRTPWLAGAWHYDEAGSIVPNNPNHPMAPWNIIGQTMEEWYETVQPTSLYQVRDRR